MNFFKTALLLAALTALVMGIGYLLAGPNGIVIGFLVACAMNAFAYWNADKMVLNMYGAQPVDDTSAPQLVGIVRQLTQNAGLPMPAVYIMHEDQPNAFATGRNPEHAAVCATTGLLNHLSQEEIAGVLGHELAHVKNRDTLTMTITATLAGALSMIATWGFWFGGSRDRENGGVGPIAGIVLMILAPLAATLVQLAISRTREYEADAEGARISGHPLWLASALGKLETLAHAIPSQAAAQNPATAHLFIVNPLSGGGMDNLFSTHPSMENRIARLEAMTGQGLQPAHAGRGPWG
jgi:heat shock protein HtpX